jgi:hypothetical protein
VLFRPILQDPFKKRENFAEVPSMSMLREGYEDRAAALVEGGSAPAETTRSRAARTVADRWFLPALVSIVVLAAVPRVLDALRYPLIFDEIYAIHLARLGLGGLLATLARDVDQPLHFIVVWAWRAIGGEADLWIKIPPLLFSLLTIVVVGRLGKAMFGAVAGLIAAALLALQPTHVVYSQQARFHAMEWLCLTALAWLAWRWMGRPKRSDAIGIVLLTAVALYTDWFTAIVIGAVLAWGAFALRREPPRLAAWLGLFALGVVLYAPELGTLAVQIRRDIHGERLLPPMAAGDVGDFLRKLAYNASYLVPLLAALVIVPLARASTRRAAAMLWWVALVTVLLPWGLSVAGIHLFITRQMLFTMPLVCLLVGAALAQVKPAWAGALASLVLVAVAARACLLRRPLEETVELPRAVEWLRAAGRADGVIVGCETRALLYVRHYLPRADARLLVMPEEEAFHYSDGILVFPESCLLTPDAFRDVTRRGAWAGIRLEHAGRDGPRSAALLGQSGATERRFGRVTLWDGGAPGGR